RGHETPLKTPGFPCAVRVCALALAIAALGAAPAHAGTSSLHWDDPVLSPFAKLLTRKALQGPPKTKAAPQPRPRHRLPRATPSFYIHYTADSVMRRRGCRAGAHRAFGIVILAFGKADYNGHSYGTQLFSGWFASNRQITRAMETFARAY